MTGTFNVRNPEIEKKLRELGDKIGAAIEGTGFGFALFLVEYNEEGGGLFYISSAEREGMVPVIRAWCDRQRQ